MRNVQDKICIEADNIDNVYTLCTENKENRISKYILRSYLPTSQISRFFSHFIPYAGLGINPTILPYAGCAVIVRTAEYWNRIVIK